MAAISYEASLRSLLVRQNAIALRIPQKKSKAIAISPRARVRSPLQSFP
ncbi:hypothetical protein Q5692_04610 [Microcoleus sp. C2C3]